MKRTWALLVAVLMISTPMAQAEVLRLAGNAWPPYTDQRLPGDGLSVELIRTALGREGYEVDYIEVPWERALLGLRYGIYDMVNAWPASGRMEYGSYSRPFLTNRVRWIQRRDQNIAYSDFDSLIPYRIGLVRGYAYSEALKDDPRLNKGYASSFVQLAKMLGAGRIDLTLEDERTVLFHLHRELRHLQDAYRFVPGAFSLLDLSLVVRTDHPQREEILATFNRGIEAMVADGSYAEIFHRYGLPAPVSLPQP
ncbi:substrate-binding periplasmic protein [Pseudomonas sp. SST3]|uniref:substrate-binding periplasmic protein n=1 Tax=Pseudomonas sp. SST3 TaxID=2267882 RepID=UPI0026A43C2B